MISILISTYNYDCYRLVCDLRGQCEACGIDYEIIVGDDCSRDKLSQIACMKVNEFPRCRYSPSAENLGLAATRNRLAEESRGDYLLFLDSDARVCTDDFIRVYLDNCSKADVIVGGIRTPDMRRDELVSRCETADLGKPHSMFVVNRTLRYKYEKNADLRRDAATRNAAPYQSLSCFNIMIRRDVFFDVRFDEQCRQYGYEDVIFGGELEQRGISILHIDNPLLHMGIDTNEQFLKKTETAIRTLVDIEPDTYVRSRLRQWSCRLATAHVKGITTVLVKCLKPMLRRNLLSTHPCLFMFSLYKLGYFLCLEQEKTVTLHAENEEIDNK